MPYEEVANFDASLTHLWIKDERVQALLDSLTEIIKTVPPNEFNGHISKLLRELATDAKKVPLEMALLHINDTDFTGIFLNETAK